MGDPEYSIVIPVYDEEESLGQLFERLAELLARLDGSAEVILVDDGSRDSSAELIRDMTRRDSRFKLVQLSRNFGHQIALTAGTDFARGRAVIIMDADLQDPPEVILQMAERWRQGYEVICAVRRQRRGESAFKRGTAAFFYRAINRLSDVDMTVDVGDFRLVDRKALDAFRSMPERNRYVRGMFGWIGFRQTRVDYDRDPRYAGRTKFSVRKMVKFALDGIISFSDLPLRLALTIGFLLAVFSILGGLVAAGLKIFGAFVVPGWASIVVVTTFLGGIQLMLMGMMGQYIARIYDEVKRRPLYLVSETHGFTEPAPVAKEDLKTGLILHP
ncbi:MAG: glycosyltransferase family 2 protein [Actinomycetota bacterium]|nr:glycosyltransferase family 2 protein [Actinomycetota bacterium]